MKDAVAVRKDIPDVGGTGHPTDRIIRTDRIPHVWCPGCGIGTSVNCFASALEKTEQDLDKVVVVSGIGCTGRVAGYVKLDSYHTTHGRGVPFAVGLKMANPELTVVVYSGDGDIAAIGGNHFIHAARRNIDIKVICVNNFIYGMTGGQVAPTTPVGATSSTSPYGNLEHPFNIPYLAAAAGAVYVARWTSLHVRRLEKSMIEALRKPGFTVIEVISPCPTVYGRRNKRGDGMNMLKYFHDNCEIRHGEDPSKVEIEKSGKIIVGKFIDIEKPTYGDLLQQLIQKKKAEAAHV
jgi:2-oxoglutarate ferredoxin oxidoreductase subunit beta